MAKSNIKRIGVGARMSQAVIHGDTVYLAGQVADKPVPSVAKQTKQILASIDKLLKQAGTDKSRILKANIWLSDMRTFDEMNGEWDKWVSKGNAPARATVESRLAGTEYLVEIMVVAAR
jgi:enamine deaminase RidA (YjgF/YER057c/UK114 family)